MQFSPAGHLRGGEGQVHGEVEQGIAELATAAGLSGVHGVCRH